MKTNIVMTMDLLKIYAGENRVNLWIEVFGEDTLNTVLPTLDIGDYTQEEHVPVSQYAQIDYYERQGFVCTERKTQHMVRILSNHMGHTWERWEWDTCDTFLTTTPYSHTWSKLVTTLAKVKFPWLFIFNVKLYDFDRLDSWFFIKTTTEEDSRKTLYVPYGCFINNDWEGIVDSHNKYHKGYYCRPERKEDLEVSLQTPNSPVAQEFKRQMEINMKKG